MSDLTDRLDEIEARAEAATPGPWEADDIGHSGAEEPSGIVVHTGAFDWDDLMRGEAESAVTWMPGWDRHHGDNAEFIAASRTDVPALVAALRAVLDLHYDAGPSQGYDFGPDGGYGWVDHCCATCGAHGEYGVEWPCPTVQAIADALGVETGASDE